MKLQAIALTNFLSHASTSWEPNGARLASIVGPNGAGKSSLLDGILYALYDDARARTDQLVRLGATDMSAAIVFDFAGATYRVVRGRTTKAGGRSYLELAVRDGEAWTTLTGDDVRATQAAIEKLLGLDAATFTTAAFLRQGDADAFISATPAERKRVLSSVLGLEVYAAAEARARELARDVEARISLERDRAERLEDEVAAGHEGYDAELGLGRTQLEITTAAIATTQANRDAIDARIRELDLALAGEDSLRTQLDAAEHDRTAAADAWRAASSRIAAAQTASAEARELLASSDDVAAAAAALPAAAERLEKLTAAEAAERRLTRDLADMDRAIRDLEIPHADKVARWQVAHDAAEARLADLREHLAAGTSVCPTCGQAIDEKKARAQLTDARAALTALGERPQEPLAIAQARAGRHRLEIRRTELRFDPAEVAAARAEAADLERTAARGEAIAQAQRILERAVADAALAEAERQQVADRGAAIAARIDGLEAQLAELEPFREERSRAGGERESVIVELDQLDSSRRQLERAIAGAEAHLAELDRKAAEASAIREQLAGDELEAGRLRRLAQAFGVTGIPARIIAGVVPELEASANELLAELRPGMTLSIETQRAKRSGAGVIEALDLAVRDPAGERGLGLYSGGERMSVSLSLAVGLSRLVARRAGARIATLVVDEPDGLDRDARRAFGQALRLIAHRGDLERVVLVSHHEDLAEFGDAIYQVTKGPRGSVVEQVA